MANSFKWFGGGFSVTKYSKYSFPQANTMVWSFSMWFGSNCPVYVPTVRGIRFNKSKTLLIFVLRHMSFGTHR